MLQIDGAIEDRELREKVSSSRANFVREEGKLESKSGLLLAGLCSSKLYFESNIIRSSWNFNDSSKEFALGTIPFTLRIIL